MKPFNSNTSQKGYSVRKNPTTKKTLKFVGKTLFFGFKEYECVEDCLWLTAGFDTPTLAFQAP